MTTAEFSNQFDVLYNNALSNMAPGLSEYDKSVFLTIAQEEVVLAYYGGAGQNMSFESTEEAREALSILVTDYRISEEATSVDVDTKLHTEYSKVFDLPDNILFMVYEEAILEDENLPSSATSKAIVVPTTLDTYYRTIRNPFMCMNDNQVLKLTMAGKRVELISKYNIKTYVLRYLRRPNPIITDYIDDATIQDIGGICECELHHIMHLPILKRAVELATKVYNSQNK